MSSVPPLINPKKNAYTTRNKFIDKAIIIFFLSFFKFNTSLTINNPITTKNKFLKILENECKKLFIINPLIFISSIITKNKPVPTK
jgi:hypothetical protein